MFFYLIIKPFISNHDWLNLTITNKDFNHVRKHTIYVKLSYYYSEKYINDKFFFNLINNIIYNPLTQLSLSFYRITFNNLDIINNVNSLEFNYCFGINDISIFNNCYHLKFNSHVYNNSNIYFHNLISLELNSCPGIIDLSPFTNVSHLVISFNSNIINNNLYFKNLKSLNLNACRSIIDLSKMTNVSHLTLSFLDIQKLPYFPNLEKIEITHCNELKDINSLKINKLKLLNIKYCDKIKTISHITKFNMLL
jgi:hypothetical protein